MTEQKPDVSRRRRGFGRSWIWGSLATLAVAVVAAGLAALAVLAERPLHHEQQWVHYINVWWWITSWLLVVPVFLTARRWPWTALPLVIVTATPQWVMAHIVKVRFFEVIERGEVDLAFSTMAYAWASVMTFAFVVAAYTGTRRHQIRPARAV